MVFHGVDLGLGAWAERIDYVQRIQRQAIRLAKLDEEETKAASF